MYSLLINKYGEDGFIEINQKTSYTCKSFAAKAGLDLQVQIIYVASNVFLELAVWREN